jgi:hypothetical protein
MNHTIHPWKFLEHFTMDEPLRVALLSIRIYSRTIVDIVFDQVFGRRDDSRGHVAAHDVDIGLFGVTYGDVAVCVDDIVVMEDVVSRDELAAELQKISIALEDFRKGLTAAISDIVGFNCLRI